MERCSAEGSGVRISQTPQVALGRAIRLRREETGLSQEALADAADLDATSIRGLERGTSNPTWDVADRVSRALGLSLHELARMADELETADRRPTNQPLDGKAGELR
jgi:transcriptional regulator with XRE-family HTH domain